MENAVEITPAALREIQQIIQNKNIPSDYSLRITIKGGRGCAGVNYTLGFDKPSETDLIYQIGQLRVIVRKAELMFLMGKKVDFYEGSDARGFLFVDQDESSTKAL